MLNTNFFNFFWELDYFFFNNSFKFNNCYSLYFLNIFIFKYSIFFIFIFIFIFYLIFNFSKIKTKSNLFLSSINLVKFLLIYSFVSSIILFYIYIYIYLFVFINYNNFLFNDLFLLKPNYYFFGIKINFDFFGIVLLLLSFLCGFLSIIALDNKIYFKNIKYLFYLNIFVIVVFFYVSSNNIIIVSLSFVSFSLPNNNLLK